MLEGVSNKGNTCVIDNVYVDIFPTRKNYHWLPFYYPFIFSSKFHPLFVQFQLEIYDNLKTFEYDEYEIQNNLLKT